MKLVYIAGPFRAKTTWEIEQNVRRAEAVALRVWQLGHVAICLHTNSRFFQGAAPDEVWLKGYLKVLEKCDAAIFVEGWESSEGSSGERRCAESLGIPTFYSYAEFKVWLTKL